jgi:hypothetical protein
MSPTDRRHTDGQASVLPAGRNMLGSVQAVQAPVQALVQALVQGSKATFSKVEGLSVQAVQAPTCPRTHACRRAACAGGPACGHADTHARTIPPAHTRKVNEEKHLQSCSRLGGACTNGCTGLHAGSACTAEPCA